LKNGHLELLDACSSKEVASWLRGQAAECRTIILDQLGIQRIVIGSDLHQVLVKGGRCHFIGRRPRNIEVKLVGEAAATSAASASLADFNRRLAPVLARNPRVLVVLCIGLAAFFVRLFDRAPVGLAIVGMSSQGKSIVQRLVMYLTGGPVELLTMNATAVGMHDHLADRPDQPVFLEDAHGGDAAHALLKAVMDTGNGARRLRAKSSMPRGGSAAVSSTLVVSAERGIGDTARSAREPVNSGIYARIFELHLGRYGMFDDLCERPDARSLADELKVIAPRYHGVLGDALTAAVAENWERVQGFYRDRISSIRDSVQQETGVECLGGLNERLLDGLSFAAFVGCVAKQLNVMDIKRATIINAFGLVFGEHLSRLKLSATPTAEVAVEAVRHYLQTNPARFLPLAQAGDPTKVNGLSGYQKTRRDGTSMFLFFPGTFRREFEADFGTEVYLHLRSAGFLVTQESRHNTYSARVPCPSGEAARRQNFVAISEAILFEDDDS
jgi:hypothetical protein